ncbi:hypothetical protein ACQP00_17915 [Dactylosporangium sp. CS-047395]|uniref:hypothetical protein n=1 Tax=Dactylosporangium sp. CS-047395 TaxID=3239936 RepID=UPI003D8DDEE8
MRALPDADPARVALVGHSMGAAAVVRAGAADQTIAATVAISIGDDVSAAVRPGPRHLLGLYGAFEPAGIGVSERAMGADRVVSVALASVLPNTVTGYLTGYLAGSGSALAVAALLIRRPSRPARPALTSVGGAALLAVGTLAAVLIPVHIGLTDIAPHGPDWWVIAVLAAAVAALLAGAHALLPPPWSHSAVLALCLPMPVASLIGAAPGFLALISPLIMVLIALYLAVCVAAGRPRWRTVMAGALTVAWPVAVVLPVLGR